jgi:hypothetical protein
MENFTQLRNLIETIRNLTFWQRLFSWKTIRDLVFSAGEELVRFNENFKNYQNNYGDLERKHNALVIDKLALENEIQTLRSSINRLEISLETTTKKAEKELFDIKAQLRQREDQLLAFNEKKDQQDKDFKSRMDQALSLQTFYETETNKLKDEQLRLVSERHDKIKRTWADHENKVQQEIKRICQKTGIEYVTNYAFRGKPDNCVRIADEIVVFDAKSPANIDDLNNFKTYIKGQAEQAKKYAEQENVRRDIYMVVPVTAMEVLDQSHFEMENYRVYIITPAALEPVMLMLRKIEDYTFAEQLSPEERDNICRIIGSLIYASKRRIQVDQYFNGHLLDLIARIYRELPDNMQEEILKSEKANKLNPPNDKRHKEINMTTLDKTHQQMDGHANRLEAKTPSNINLQE